MLHQGYLPRRGAQRPIKRSVSFALRILGKNDTKMRVAWGFYALQDLTICIYFNKEWDDS